MEAIDPFELAWRYRACAARSRRNSIAAADPFWDRLIGMTGWRGVVESAADSMIAAGADGVALMGSYARGDQHRLSDLDIVGLGQGDAAFREVDGVILSVSWVERDAAVASFASPAVLIFTVPGWRTATPLRDHNGCVADIIAAAHRWQWDDQLERDARAWLAKEVTGYCEEVFGLIRSLECGAEYPAAVIRSVFALRSARLIAVRHGVLYESEKQLWDLVADHQGATWRTAQEAAFGLRGESLGVSARAGLQLYTFAAETAWPDLTTEQRVVVRHALDEIEALGVSA